MAMSTRTFAVDSTEWPPVIHKARCAHLRLANPGLVFTFRTTAGTARAVVDAAVAFEPDFFGKTVPTFAPCVPKTLSGTEQAMDETTADVYAAAFSDAANAEAREWYPEDPEGDFHGLRAAFEAGARWAAEQEGETMDGSTTLTIEQVRAAVVAAGFSTEAFDAWLERTLAEERERAIRDLTVSAEKVGEHVRFDGADFDASAIPTYRLHEIAADLTDPKGADHD